MRRYQIAGCVSAICIWLVSTGIGQVAVQKTPDRISVLIQSLDDLDPQKRTDAVQRLLNLGEPARVALRLALPNASPQSRPLMDRVLLHMHWVKSDDSDFVEQILTGYADQNAAARCAKVEQLSTAAGPSGEVFVRVLLNDPSAAVRWVAADCLRRMLDNKLTAGKNLAAIVDGTEKPSAMYLPATENAPLLAITGWTFHDLQPRRAEDLLQRAIALEKQQPSASVAQVDFVFQWLIHRADLHRNRGLMIQLLRQQAGQIAWAPYQIPDPVADLIATQADFGPFPGFNADLRTYRNYLGHPEMVYAIARLMDHKGHPHVATVLNTVALLLSGTSADDHLLAGEFLVRHDWNIPAEREYLWSLKCSSGKNPYAYFRLSELASVRNDDLAAAQYEELGLQQSPQLSREQSDGILAEVHWHYLRTARDSHDAAAIKLHLDKLLSMNADAQVFHTEPSIVSDVVPALQDQGRVEEADRIFAQGFDDLTKLMEASPDDAMAKNNLAWLCACAGKRLDFGKKFADQAVADMPEDAACLDTQAEVYWRLGDANKAAAIESHALQIKPDDTYMARQLSKFSAATKSEH